MSWEAVNAAVAEAHALVAAAAPDAGTAAAGEAYVSRVLSAVMTPAFHGHLLRADGLSQPLPCHGGPNPDYRMQHAAVDPAGHYRLEGQIRGSERVGVGLYAVAPEGNLAPRGYARFGPADCDANGAFALDIGPAGGLELRPDTRILLIRTLHRDADTDPARLRLHGAPPAHGQTLMGGSNDAALAFTARSLLNAVREYLRWTAAVVAHPNRFAPAPPHLAETVQGDPDTHYFLAGFDLAEGEVLDVKMPQPLSGYWSVHAYDHWFQHLQVPGADDRSGRTQFTVGPGGTIDTLGHRRGSLICRIIGEGGCPDARLSRAG